MSDTTRDEFEAWVCDVWRPDDGRSLLQREYPNMAFAAWQAAQSQPAPPVQQSVQEIMRLMRPYISACIKASRTPLTEIETASEAYDEAFQPLEAALTALVNDNHRLKFALDGVNAMRKPLTNVQIDDVWIYAEPGTTVREWIYNFARAIENAHGIEPEQGGVDMQSENAAWAAAKPVATPTFGAESAFDETAKPAFRPSTDGYYKISGRDGLVLFKSGIEVSEPEQGDVK